MAKYVLNLPIRETCHLKGPPPVFLRRRRGSRLRRGSREDQNLVIQNLMAQQCSELALCATGASTSTLLKIRTKAPPLTAVLKSHPDQGSARPTKKSTVKREGLGSTKILLIHPSTTKGQRGRKLRMRSEIKAKNSRGNTWEVEAILPPLRSCDSGSANKSQAESLSPPLALAAPHHSPPVVACVAPSNSGALDGAGDLRFGAIKGDGAEVERCGRWVTEYEQSEAVPTEITTRRKEDERQLLSVADRATRGLIFSILAISSARKA
ncbi:hypothetical protein U1Q18_045253 [Sarracenia purpurea var. burkii]